MRSRVTVGKGAEAEMEAMPEENGISVLVRKLPPISPSPLGIDPDNSIDAAAEVVDAIAIAGGGNGWLCFPSYVVVRIERSSAHLCT